MFIRIKLLIYFVAEDPDHQSYIKHGKNYYKLGQNITKQGDDYFFCEIIPCKTLAGAIPGIGSAVGGAVGQAILGALFPAPAAPAGPPAAGR